MDYNEFYGWPPNIGQFTKWDFPAWMRALRPHSTLGSVLLMFYILSDVLLSNCTHAFCICVYAGVCVWTCILAKKKICLARQQPCTHLSRSGGAPVALGFETVASGSDTLCLVASFTLRAVSLPIRAHHVVSVVDYEMQWNEITPNKQLMNIKWESFCLRHFSCGFSDSVIATHT